MGRLLSIGITGEDVRVLQKLLNHHLAPPLSPIAEDGIFGRDTRNRVIEFQRRNLNYPAKMPIPGELGSEFKRPLKVDGIVGPLTSNVLWDVRTVKTTRGLLSPVSENRPSSSTNTGRSTFAIDADPAPAPGGGPKNFRLVQLSLGQQATANPWSLSPLVFTAQYSLLAKDDGRPDFLLTGGGQIAMNDGGANGRWSGQIFGQMGLGGFDKLKLFGDKLDWFNPFVAVMLNGNFSSRLKPLQGTVGLAIGNQATWTILHKPLPGTKDDFQDTLSFFLNTQVVSNVDLSNGQCAAPSGQFLIGVMKTFF
jgi:hypothetical protein